jgi:hypothetical protein
MKWGPETVANVTATLEKDKKTFSFQNTLMDRKALLLKS